MPMSPRLLRPRQTIHPEAADWANRVRTNGGSVSGTTLTAVDRFVKAIHAAGIRDRFYRLNLFCGNSDASLNAVRTPLYRGPSLTGTQYGNTIDTNFNFVQGDYAETGASGGLNTQSTFTKYIACGSDFPVDVASLHMATYERLRSGQTNQGGFGMHVTGGNGNSRIQHRGTSNGRAWIGGDFWGGDFSPISTITATTFLVASRVSASYMFVQFNGTENGGDWVARTIGAGGIGSVAVFASVGGGSFHTGILAAYSYGAGMTTSQSQAFNTAMQSFQTALGRGL